jgi:hypothetical protein
MRRQLFRVIQKLELGYRVGVDRPAGGLFDLGQPAGARAFVFMDEARRLVLRSFRDASLSLRPVLRHGRDTAKLGADGGFRQLGFSGRGDQRPSPSFPARGWVNLLGRSDCPDDRSFQVEQRRHANEIIAVRRSVLHRARIVFLLQRHRDISIS